MGNPLGLLLFCLTIHPILRELSSFFTLVLWMTLPLAVQNHWLPCSDVKHINNNVSTIGLNLNFIKCKQTNKLSSLTSEPIGQFFHCTINNATLHGTPFDSFVPCPAIDSARKKKLDDLKRAPERFQLMMRLYAFVLRAAY